jgi:hypothetical protein
MTVFARHTASRSLGLSARGAGYGLGHEATHPLSMSHGLLLSTYFPQDSLSNRHFPLPSSTVHREAKRERSRISPNPAGEDADPGLLRSLRRREEVGIPFLCLWRVDRVWLVPGGGDLEGLSPFRYNNPPLFPLLGAALGGAELKVASSSRRSEVSAISVFLGVVVAVAAAGVLQFCALRLRYCRSGVGCGRLGGCSGLWFVGGSKGSEAGVEHLSFVPRGSMDSMSSWRPWQVDETASATVLSKVCSPLPLRRCSGDSSIGGAGDGCCVCRRWALPNLDGDLSTAASAPTPARWSFGFVARRLPDRDINQGLAGHSCGAAMAAAAARLRLASEFRVVEHLRDCVVILSLCEVFSAAVDPL